ncbi:MAG: AmmeMemoRadiSam system protein B [Isosphaeraceae bacterium]|nr:AmmeMemoRadiSam system protein B [Isosphaeraceae bacterium]
MASLDLPKLRPLGGHILPYQGQTYIQFDDALGLADPALLVPLELFYWVIRRFDGQTPLSTIQADVLREVGHRFTDAELEEVVRQLDEAMILDGPTFAAFVTSYRRQPTRPAAFAGRSYAGTAQALRTQLARLFVHADGAGMPRVENGHADGNGLAPAGRLRGILSPHIDFHRGGPVYTWSYRALVERSDADTFVILGVAHQPCRHRFALTRKDFETPLGLVRTDRGYVDRIAAEVGDHLFDDELIHRTEHSIEFQVVFLQYLLGNRRPFSIVPILVGSFHDLMELGIDPILDAEVRRFIEALRAAESESSRKVAYIGGIDLAHVGPEFGDPDRLSPAILEEVRRFDTALLDRAVAADPAGWFETAAAVENRWRVCGLAATYTMLHAMGPARGRLLRYDQAVNPERTCGVSFASIAFQALEAPDVASVLAP